MTDRRAHPQGVSAAGAGGPAVAGSRARAAGGDAPGSSGSGDVSAAGSGGLDLVVARILLYGTYLSVLLIAIGVVLMLAAGISPLDDAPPLDVSAIPADIVALDPAGFLWLGLLAVIATPSARVIASLVVYARGRDWQMVAVSVGIITVIATSVLLAVGLEG